MTGIHGKVACVLLVGKPEVRTIHGMAANARDAAKCVMNTTRGLATVAQHVGS